TSAITMPWDNLRYWVRATPCGGVLLASGCVRIFHARRSSERSALCGSRTWPSENAQPRWSVGNCQPAGTLRKTNSRFRKRLVLARRLPCAAAMTLKIEIASDGETATFRLSGCLEEVHLVELQAEVQRYRPRLAFDLAETVLV